MSRIAGVAAAVTVSVALLSTGCGKDQPLQAPPVGAPTYLISDGAHSGNSAFLFLPPLVPNPSAFFHAGTFNATLSPAVDVCILDHDPRLLPPTPPATCVGNPVFGPAPMVLDLANQQYTRNWDTKALPGLDASKFYRIQVRGAPGGSILGFLDVDPVDQGVKNLRTGDVVQFQDGRTLPISVRIEQGAFGTTNPDHVERSVGNVATIVTTNTGFAGVSFPDNWLPTRAVAAGITQVVVIIERIPVHDNDPTDTCFGSGLLELEGCYRFRTDPALGDFGPFNVPEGATFAQQVIAGVCFERPQLEETDAPFQLYRQEEGVEFGRPVPLASAPAGFLSCGDFTPTAVSVARSGGLWGLVDAGWRSVGRSIARLVTPRSLHAVDFGAGGSTDGFSRFGWARPAAMTKNVDTDNQSAVAGTAVALDPQVCLTTTHHISGPLGDAEVTFTVATGGGTIGGGRSAVRSTDSETGCASAPWVLGTTPGANTLNVTAQADGSPQTFTATGVLGTLLVRPSSQGLMAMPGITLPLTQTSGLSMQDGTGIQLEVSPSTGVTWSSSDPTSATASVNTTGLVAVVQGNDDATTANEVVFTASGTSARGTVKLNSFTFDHFPRLTTLVWRSVAGAASYDVIVEFGNGATTADCGATPADCATWAQEFSQTTTAVGLVFGFVGKQPGRWHVVARDAGGIVINTSELVYFRYIN